MHNASPDSCFNVYYTCLGLNNSVHTVINITGLLNRLFWSRVWYNKLGFHLEYVIDITLITIWYDKMKEVMHSVEHKENHQPKLQPAAAFWRFLVSLRRQAVDLDGL